MSQPRRPRRAPTQDERARTADQSREKILHAAVQEFAAKGYAGARTAGIAARAGVNQQLIAYYFGGKQGVLDELRRQWSARQDAVVDPDASFATSLAAHLDHTLDSPEWARLVIWRALGDGPDATNDPAFTTQLSRLKDAVHGVRQRQRDGELTARVDPEFILLMAYLVAFAPIALPHVVQTLFEVDPLSREYRQRCVTQLLTLLEPA